MQLWCFKTKEKEKQQRERKQIKGAKLRERRKLKIRKRLLNNDDFQMMMKIRKDGKMLELEGRRKLLHILQKLERENGERE